MKLKLREKTLDLKRPVLMGVLNVTPDSFSDGGKYRGTPEAVKHAKTMVREGARIIDIGGESSRPGAQPVSWEQELDRVLPVVRALRGSGAILSIDTYKPEVAQACLEQGAHLINDIYGLSDARLRSVIRHFDAGAIIMHMQNNPQTMQQEPRYQNVVKNVKRFLMRQTRIAQGEGIRSVLVDPGIGFGKTLQHNLALLQGLENLDFGRPLVVGVSRKSFIGQLTQEPVENRLEGTLAAVAACVLNGADILRVHDVDACKKAVDVAWAIKSGKGVIP